MLNKILTNKEKYIFLLKYYLLIFLRGAFFLKSYAVLLLDDILTPMQASMVVSVASITTIVLSIPISYLSTKIGCKNTILSGITLFIASYTGLLCSRNVFTFVFYFFCFSIYTNVFYTSLETLVYGNIRSLGLKDLFSKYRAMSRICKLTSIALAVYLAGKLIYTNVNIIFLVDLFILSLTLIIVITIKEKRTQGSIKLTRSYKKLLIDAFKYISKHRILRNMLIFQAIWSAILSFTTLYRSLYCEEIAINDYNIGLMLSLQTIISSIVQILFIRFAIKKNIPTKSVFFILGGICFLIATHHYHSMYSYIYFSLFIILAQFSDTLTYPKMISFIPERFMPTVLSIFMLSMEFLKSIILYVFGYISHVASYKMAFWFIGIIFTLSSCIAYLIMNHDKHLLKK